MFPYFKMHSESISARLAKETSILHSINLQLSNVNFRHITRGRNVMTLLTSLSNSPDKLSERVDILFKIVVIKTKNIQRQLIFYMHSKNNNYTIRQTNA